MNFQEHIEDRSFLITIQIQSLYRPQNKAFHYLNENWLYWKDLVLECLNLWLMLLINP